MAKRKRGNNKREPRMTAAGQNSQCISIMPDGSASYFTPKRDNKKTRVQVNKNGKYEIVQVERALR
jgi:hypothetical protein